MVLRLVCSSYKRVATLVIITLVIVACGLWLRLDSTHAGQHHCMATEGQYTVHDNTIIAYMTTNAKVHETPTHLFHFMEDVMALEPHITHRLQPRSRTINRRMNQTTLGYHAKDQQKDLYHALESAIAAHDINSRGKSAASYASVSYPCLFAMDLDPSLLSPLQLSNLFLLSTHGGCSEIAFIVVKGPHRVNAPRHTSAYATIGPKRDLPNGLLQVGLLYIQQEAIVYKLEADGVSLTCLSVPPKTLSVHRFRSVSRDRRKWLSSRAEWLRLSRTTTNFCKLTNAHLGPIQEKDSHRFLLINRDKSRRIILADSCRDRSKVEIHETALHDSSHICSYITLMREYPQVIFPHGYSGTLLLYARPDQIAREFYPCNYYKPAYKKIETFTTFRHDQFNCTCAGFPQRFVSKFISLNDCMDSYPCRTFFRHQDIHVSCDGEKADSIFRC
eukprot:TRINITY_DN8386_c0_g2_i1.p1 TRINITY_DN8386_c0_g2~~TRINITY_DN8386_c0_g2_i1.p1  ORF type:complete len:445 (+),score=60.67 TRINITY_DN8386_c0_g2_i1:68-1402(+)